MRMDWISTSDRLPETDGSYIVHSSKSGAVYTAHFWTSDKRWSGSSRHLFISHWMPLPEPPYKRQLTSYCPHCGAKMDKEGEGNA